MKYDILDDNGDVVGTIIADREFVEANFPLQWVEHVPPEDPLPPKWLLSKRDFKNRFPRAKWNAASIASQTDPALWDFFESFRLASQIDLQNEEIVMAMAFLSNEQIPPAYRLTEAEVNAVLTVPASPTEAP